MVAWQSLKYLYHTWVALQRLVKRNFVPIKRWNRVEQSQASDFSRHLHSKGYKGTGLSKSLNSCRTSKRGIADKPQCPSNSFRLQILIAFTIESEKSSAYFIRRAFIFLLEQILFYKYSILGKCFKVCPPGEARTEKKVPSTLCILSLSPSSRNTLHTDQVALTIYSEPHPTIVNALILRM